MEATNQSVAYEIRFFEDDYFMGDTKIFSYHLEYLYFQTDIPGFAAQNDRIKRQALGRQSYAINTLYNYALQRYLSGGEGLPFEYTTKVTVTMNQNYIFSVFLDEYVYSGGKEGNVSIISRNIDTRNGQLIGMCSLMSQANCLPCIRNTIVQQIQTSGNTANFLPDYASLVTRHFSVESFYITNQGIVVYFRVGEIAPANQGIQKFLIPFKTC